MNVQGNLIKILPEIGGTSKAGNPWTKGAFLIQIPDDKYPKQIVFDTWSEMIENVKNVPIGSSIDVSFDAESKEFNGRYFTNLKAYKIEVVGQSAQTSQPQSSANPNTPSPSPLGDNQDNKDLPF
jgi:hypothetical protein